MRKVNFVNGLTAGLLAVSLYGGAVAAQGVLNSPAFTDVSAETLALNSQFLREGADAPLSRILSVQHGQQESQVSQLIGQPVAVSNANGVHTWEYHFSLPFDQRGDALVCQFMVQFNTSTGVVEDTYWRRPQCKDLAGTAVNLSADVLFDFDEARLSPAGKAAIDNVLLSLPEQGEPLSVNVVGYTDRLGDSAYNQQLSERRAMSAADHLVSRGVPRSAVRAYGYGETEPVVMCEGSQPTAALKECLAPNRRISLQIKAATH